jgi:hypothetical protein
MIGMLLIGSAVAPALLLAASARLASLVSALLAAYLAFVANLGIVTLVLSPVHAVTRGGLAAAEGLLLAGALVLWWARGRPALPVAAARAAAREIVTDPVTAVFLVIVVALLAYEVVLASAPPNNMDSLTYHLARVAAWIQHGGIHWIANAPEVELNAYQPLAEQQILFLFVATGTGALFAVPQYLAQLAILVAVYGASRRLGFQMRAAACSAFLLATFSVVALESVTAQNDLVTASFAAVATCLLLGEGRLEPALAGAAAAFGVGTKLTAVLVLPILAWLAFTRGRRIFTTALAGGAVGFVALGMWGYVLNLVNTGHVLGTGTGYVQDRASPSYPGSVANAFYLMYGTMDASVLSSRLIHLLALAGAALAVLVVVWALWRRLGARRAVGVGTGAALPFLAPLLVIGGAGVIAYLARLWGFPIRGPGGIIGPVNEILNQEYTRIANENYSAYGPVGIVALLAASALTIWAYARRRVDSRHLVLACALPIFLVLISLESRWVPFLIRFFLLPAVIAAPLLARLFVGRLTTAAYVVAASVAIGLTITHDQPKPLDGPYGRPWSLTQLTALDTNSDTYVSTALAAFDGLVPAHACVGAAIAPNEPSYLLFGPKFEHRVVYLSVNDALAPAYRHGLVYVVFSVYPGERLTGAFTAAGWKLQPLGDLWRLATDVRVTASAPRAGACRGRN